MVTSAATTMSGIPTGVIRLTYMGGSEGVMQVADYGEIQFETWLHSSYGIWWKNMLPNSFKNIGG